MGGWLVSRELLLVSVGGAMFLVTPLTPADELTSLS